MALTPQDLKSIDNLITRAIRRDVSPRFAAVDIRFDAVDARFYDLESKMVPMEARLATAIDLVHRDLTHRTNDHEARITRLEQDR